MPNESSIRLIVGLGNPGSEYALSRHNAGFMVLDALSDAFAKATDWERQCSGLMRSIQVRGQKILLLKPMTYMNLSGDAVSQATHQFGLKSDEILVVYDDLDIPLGALRLRKFGSAGGHNGMNSIIEKLKSAQIPRLRMGIGQTEARRKQIDYVLDTFATEEIPLFAHAVQDAVESIRLILARGMEVAMSQFNQKVSPPHAEATPLETHHSLITP